MLKIADFFDIEGIKATLSSYLDGVPKTGLTDFDEPYPFGLKDILLSLMAEYLSYTLYKANLMKDETFIKKAKLKSSVYRIARDNYRYNINRMSAPAISVKYTGSLSKILNYGDIIGTLGKYDIVYMGEEAVNVEHGDIILGYLGKLVKSGIFDVGSAITKLTLTLKATTLKAIHGDAPRLIIDNKVVTVSKRLRDFLIYKQPIDFSLDTLSTELKIFDKGINTGYLYSKDDKGSDVAIKEYSYMYLETDGEGTVVPENNINLAVFPNKDWLAVKMMLQGGEGDTIDFIRDIAPLYYSTQGAGITIKDYDVLLKAHPFIHSVKVEKPISNKISYKIQVKDNFFGSSSLVNDLEFYITTDAVSINEVKKYKVIAGSVITKDDFYTALMNVYANDPVFDLKKEGTGDDIYLVLTYDDVFNTPSIKVSNATLSVQLLSGSYVNREYSTIYAYYVNKTSFNKKEVNSSLNSAELLKLAEYIQTIKLVGLTIKLKHAVLYNGGSIDIPVICGYSDIFKTGDVAMLKKDFDKKVKELLSFYEYQPSKTFIYQDFLYKVGGLTYFDNKVKSYLKYVNTISFNAVKNDVNIGLDTKQHILKAGSDKYFRFVPKYYDLNGNVFITEGDIA